MASNNSIPRARRVLGPAALLGVGALVLTGCGAAPDSSSSNAESADFTGCIVSDSGGFNDRSFNQLSYQGLEEAKDEYGIKVNKAESQAETDFEPNLNSMVQGGCDLTFSAGFLIADATKAVAKANPDSHFAIIDDSTIDLPNVKPVVFNTAEASFLAGYLAAGASKTGTVATYGGMKIPSVTVFMDGFADGVDHYNKTKGKNVKLLGWNKKSQNGTFVNSFENASAGKTTTQNFINEGADVVMPVAGGVNTGSVDAALEANKGDRDVRLIWVDADGYDTVDAGKELLLTSVLKRMDLSVKDTVKATMDSSSFDNTTYVGDLANEGVGLAPYHDQESKLDDGLKKEVDQLRQEIVDGKITVQSDSSPKKN